MSDDLISIFFTIFIGIVNLLSFWSEPLLWLYYLLTGIAFGSLMFALAPTHCREIFPCHVFMYLITVNFVQANVVQATIHNSVWDFDLVYAYWYARLPIHNVHQLPSQFPKDPATELLNGTKSLRQHVPYRQFVWANDMLNQQDPHYWQQVLKRKQIK